MSPTRSRRRAALTGIVAGLTAGLVAAVLPASAAGAPPPQAAAPGTVSTIAGDLGGQGPSRSASLRPCAVTYSGGALYVIDQVVDPIFDVTPTVVQRIETSTDLDTTLAGTGRGRQRAVLQRR